MKKLIILLFLGSFLLVGCSKDDNSGQRVRLYLEPQKALSLGVDNLLQVALYGEDVDSDSDDLVWDDDDEDIDWDGDEEDSTGVVTPPIVPGLKIGDTLYIYSSYVTAADGKRTEEKRTVVTLSSLTSDIVSSYIDVQFDLNKTLNVVLEYANPYYSQLVLKSASGNVFDYLYTDKKGHSQTSAQIYLDYLRQGKW